MLRIDPLNVAHSLFLEFLRLGPGVQVPLIGQSDLLDSKRLATRQIYYEKYRAFEQA